MLRFRRKIETCDSDYDLAITNDTFRVIWAYSDQDPEPGTVRVWSRLDRAGGRGACSPNLIKWVVTPNHVTLPEEETLYWCTIVKLPVLSQKHQLMLYECHDQNPDDTFKQHVYKSGYKCYNPNMPDDFKKCLGLEENHSIFPVMPGTLWAGTLRGHMFEVHYENPGLHANILWPVSPSTKQLGLEFAVQRDIIQFIIVHLKRCIILNKYSYYNWLCSCLEYMQYLVDAH